MLDIGLSAAAAVLLACGLLVSSAASDQQLLDLKSVDLAKLPSRDAKVTVAQRPAGPALRVTTGHAQDWPGIDLAAPTGHWDLSKYAYIAVSVRNVGANSVDVHLRVDNPGADGVHHCNTNALTLKPGQTGTLQTTFTRSAEAAGAFREVPKLFAMRGFPQELGMEGGLDPANVTNLVVFVARPNEDHAFEISDIHAGGTYVAPRSPSDAGQPFLPFIDQFGQYIHREWPGKVHAESDFPERVKAEEADLKQHSGPDAWDKYGGWANGPKLRATGFFRVQKYRGKWWLVDPEGHLFFSHGTDCANPYEGNTPVDDREAWFASLPPRDGQFASCYSQAGYNVMTDHYKGKRPWCFDFGRANLLRKYGAEWPQRFADVTHRRLRSWGLNTIGNWSDAAIYRLDRTPYVRTCGTGGKLLAGSQGYWGKFRDVFDPSFCEDLRRQVQEDAGQCANDPWCIGYFVDNEIAWGDEVSLATAALLSPPEQVAKQVFVADLKAKYGDIARLNAAWGTDHASWEALLAYRGVPDRQKAYADLTAFYTKTAETYFRTCRDIVKQAAPNHLYLGCRFAWVNHLAAEAAAKFCDVVSYNLYTRSVADFKFPGKADVPLIIGEFHFGALDRGMFHTGLVPCASQAERAAAYKSYVEGALRHPQFVGTHWFKYVDESTVGRPLDGENYQIGLVDICDSPYPETIAAVREVGYGMYEYRLNTK